MARIPSAEGLGEVVPQMTPYVEASPNARGAGLARGVMQAGQVLQGMAIDEARQARATRDAADRAQALDALNYTGDEMNALRDDFTERVRTGAVDKRTAAEEWQQVANERIAAAMDGVPDSHRATVRRGLDHRVSMLSRDVGRAVLQRDQSDIGAGINSTLEHAQRLYGVDPIQAEALVAGSLVELGPAAGLTPEQIGARRQKWREDAQYVVGYEALSAGRDDAAALQGAEATIKRLDAIDPKRRAELLDRAEMYRINQQNRAESAERRARDLAEQRLRMAEHSATALQQLADKGTLIAPQEIDQAHKAVAGTPYEAVVKAIVQQSRETGGLAARSPAELDGIIQFLDTKIAQEGRSQALDKRRDQVVKVRDAMVKDMAEDPLGGALARGWITEVAPIDSRTPETLLSSMGQRVQQAEMVGAKLGKAVSPLRDREAAVITDALGMTEPRAQSQALAALSQSLTPATVGAVADQIGKDRKEFGIALKVGAGKTTADRQLSELVLRGAKGLRDKTVQKDDAALTGWRSKLAEVVTGTIGDDGAEREIMDAAYYIMAAQELDGIKAPGFSRGIGSGAEDAVAMVAGRPVTRQGMKTLLPRGMTEDAFDDAMLAAARDQVQQLTPTGKVYLRGQEVDFATGVLPRLYTYGLMRDSRGRFIPAVRGAPFTLDPGGTLPLAIRVP